MPAQGKSSHGVGGLYMKLANVRSTMVMTLDDRCDSSDVTNKEDAGYAEHATDKKT